MKYFIYNICKSLKFYFVLLFIIIITIIMWSQNNLYSDQKSLEPVEIVGKLMQDNNKGLKYILVWTKPTQDPIMHLEVGQKAFVKRHCPNTNCYVSPDKNYFHDIRKFDVIIFHAKDIIVKYLPKVRSQHQKYVFATMESAGYYPVCTNIFNNYFNWTWTYKLNSDLKYGYISIRNKSGDIIGPKQIMSWIKVDEMAPIDESLKKKLNTKKKAAAWFVSNCKSKSKRENVAENLGKELEKFSLTLDIYGQCSQKKCPKLHSADCLSMVETDYHFYLSFENSFSEDYVTEKLLNALQNYAVPVVYGGANYTRFMPDGIYLDARKLTIPDLASKMVELINDKNKYYNYFKWHNYYSYHDDLDSPQSDPYCSLCAMVNDEQRLKKTSAYHDFNEWWNPPNTCK